MTMFGPTKILGDMTAGFINEFLRGLTRKQVSPTIEIRRTL